MEELHFNADITGERIDKFLDGRNREPFPFLYPEIN